MTLWSEMKSLRWSTVVLGGANLAIACAGGHILFYGLADCDKGNIKVPVVFVSVLAVVKIISMVRMGLSQRSIAHSVVDSTAIADSVNRLQRRLRYKSWLCWSRFGMSVTVLQMLCAIYLVFNVVKFLSLGEETRHCVNVYGRDQLDQKLLCIYSILACAVPVFQCFAGSDVLRWRSFYATRDEFWKTHYQEVFDHGIREALCCLGRFKYLSASEEDEVFAVARLLGDLISYRASGRGHLELLTGLALLHKDKGASNYPENLVEAPKQLIEDAFTFHKFAEAAYTGPLLDFGRHTVFFSCCWLYRQGVLTPWLRNRRPILAGDNWWRGHAAAFLNYADIRPESLRFGRVCQAKCQAAYFVVISHLLKSVIIAVRGTETPEDLITDGLGRECHLSQDDFPGLFSHVDPNVVDQPPLHYGHSGIVEAARDLYIQLEGNAATSELRSRDTLPSLLGAGCECEGYHIRIVGHSLGGAIATFLGLKLLHRYPNLHVFAYGPLPCMDLELAEACTPFVTSIIHDNEFSARLSVCSVLRLRAAAIEALAQDGRADTTSILRLARRFLYLSDYQRENNYVDVKHVPGDCRYDLPFQSEGAENQIDDTVGKLLDSSMNPPEMYLPGRIIHLLRRHDARVHPLWKTWRAHVYKAYLAPREGFKEIVVSPSMFFDHLPWRCHCALRMVLEDKDDTMLPDVFQLV